MESNFIDELASSAPTPGGGGASAAVGAIAAALASMVGELTVGKKRYADVQDEVIGSLGRLAILRSRLLSLVDEDAEAFKPLAAAYSMPKETPDEQAAKESTLQNALIGATEVPLDIMRTCIDVLHECDFMAHKGSRMAVSDAGACAVLAKAAVISASLNVFINVGSISDGSLAQEYAEEANALMDKAVEMGDGIYDYVRSELS